jgi:hypothetical protein
MKIMERLCVQIFSKTIPGATMESQNKAILSYMRGNWISPMSALKLFGSWALSSRISEIDGKSGHKRMLRPKERIDRRMVKDAKTGKRWTEYRVVKA